MGRADRRRGALGRRPPGRPPIRPGVVARRRCSQRRRRLPVLDPRGDHRRHRYAPSPLARGDRELRTRCQYRLGGAHRQCIRRAHRAHRRASAVESARRHGDRPLSAVMPPRQHHRAAGVRGGRRLDCGGGGQRPGCGAPGADRVAAGMPAVIRPGRARHYRRRPCRRGGHGVDRPVRVDAKH